MPMHYFTAIIVKIRIEIAEETNSLYGTNIKTIFTHNLHWTELQFSDFCRDYDSPDRRDVLAGLTDRMIYHRHVGGFLVFS
jgi:hypothetical protein